MRYDLMMMILILIIGYMMKAKFFPITMILVEVDSPIMILLLPLLDRDCSADDQRRLRYKYDSKEIPPSLRVSVEK